MICPDCNTIMKETETKKLIDYFCENCCCGVERYKSWRGFFRRLFGFEK